VDARGRPHVARATRFLSHAWSFAFAGLLAALEAHADGAPDAEDAYFWIGARAWRKIRHPPGESR
jgi:hypothetical protein